MLPSMAQQVSCLATCALLPVSPWPQQQLSGGSVCAELRCDNGS